MARRPQTPEEKKRSAVALLIFALVILIVGILLEVNSRKIKQQCSSYVSGIITNVESKRVRTRNRRSTRTHTEYQAYIRLEGDSPFGRNEIVSGWTRTRYHAESVIKVYYNPENPSVYFAEGDEPQSGFSLIVISLVFLAGGVWYLKTASDEEKQLRDFPPEL